MDKKEKTLLEEWRNFAYAYDIKTKDDWKENKILVISEHQIKKEILDKYYPGLSIREQLVFDRGWELVNKLNEYANKAAVGNDKQEAGVTITSTPSRPE